MLTDQNSGQKAGQSSIDTLVNDAITKYKTAIVNEYGKRDTFAYLGLPSIDKYIKHVEPLMLKLCKTIQAETPEVFPALEEFLMDFSEVGVNKRTPNLKPNVSLVRAFYNDASRWGSGRDLIAMPDPSIEEQLASLSAIKLKVLFDAGVLYSSFETLDKYEQARMNSSHATFNAEAEPGCFGYAVSWFNERLGKVPDKLVLALKSFYREIVRPTTDNIDKVKRDVAKGKFLDFINHYNSDKPYG